MMSRNGEFDTPIGRETLEIETLDLVVNVMKLGGRQLTQSVFRQFRFKRILPCEGIHTQGISVSDGEIHLDSCPNMEGEPIAWVNYCWKQALPGENLLWREGPNLHRQFFSYAFMKGLRRLREGRGQLKYIVGHTGSESPEEWVEPFWKRWDELEKVGQIYIAV